MENGTTTIMCLLWLYFYPIKLKYIEIPNFDPELYGYTDGSTPRKYIEIPYYWWNANQLAS